MSIKKSSFTLFIVILLGFGLVPMTSQAGTCVCYFGSLLGTNNCSPYQTESKDKCDELCHKQYQNNHRTYDFDSDNSDADLLLECQIASSNAAQAKTQDQENERKNRETVVFEKPVLNIDIPTVSFSAPFQSGNLVKSSALAEYLSGIYTYLLAVSVVLAIVMIMIGGLQYTLGGINSGQLEKGKSRIKNGITGLALLFSVYLFLYTVNPNALTQSPIDLEIVEKVDLENLVPDNAGADAPDNPFTPLIGPTPANLANCSVERATWAAQKLEQAQVCVGPCHCAWTASRFLTYLGCPDTSIHGSVSQLATTLESKGWITEPMQGEPSSVLKKYGVGLTVYHDSHVGVNIGNGLSFESGGNSTKWFKIVGNECPQSNKDSVAKPDSCNVCAKIPSESPSTGRFQSPGCNSNQAWMIRNNNYWTVIVRPPVNGETVKKGCCDNAIGHHYISSTLCTALNAKWREVASQADCK